MKLIWSVWEKFRRVYDRKIIGFLNSVQYIFLQVVFQDMNELILYFRWQVPLVIIYFQVILSKNRIILVHKFNKFFKVTFTGTIHDDL